MFEVGFREEAERFLISLAEEASRITAAAVVGSRAHAAGDQWSDIDLTFAVEDEIAPVERYADALVRSLDPAELERALEAAINLRERPSAGTRFPGRQSPARPHGIRAVKARSAEIVWCFLGRRLWAQKRKGAHTCPPLLRCPRPRGADTGEP